MPSAVDFGDGQGGVEACGQVHVLKVKSRATSDSRSSPKRILESRREPFTNAILRQISRMVTNQSSAYSHSCTFPTHLVACSCCKAIRKSISYFHWEECSAYRDGIKNKWLGLKRTSTSRRCDCSGRRSCRWGKHPAAQQIRTQGPRCS
jgi:hypothetical protein